MERKLKPINNYTIHHKAPKPMSISGEVFKLSTIASEGYERCRVAIQERTLITGLYQQRKKNKENKPKRWKEKIKG